MWEEDQQRKKPWHTSNESNLEHVAQQFSTRTRVPSSTVRTDNLQAKGYIPGNFSSLSPHSSLTSQSMPSNAPNAAFQGASTLQISRPSSAHQTASNQSISHGDRPSVVRPVNNRRFNSRFSMPHGGFREIVQRVFRHGSLNSSVLPNSTQHGHGILGTPVVPGHESQPISQVVKRRPYHSEASVIKDERNRLHSSHDRTIVDNTTNMSTNNASMNQRESSVALPDLGDACTGSEYAHFPLEWMKVVLNHNGLEGDKPDEPLGWFFTAKTKPIITFAQNLESAAFPYYHVSRPLYIDPHQVGRKIQNVPIPTEISQIRDSFNFSILSYNILSDDLLWENSSLYRNNVDWTLYWDYRKDNLMKEIESYNADIICLQEVQRDHFDNWLSPVLHRKGYVGLYKQRTGGKSDGCATFFRGERFTCREKREVEYKIEGIERMDRDNIGLIVALEPKQYGKQSNKPVIFIANTHLLFNRKRGDIKLLQLARLLSEIDELAKIHSYLPQKATNEDMYSPIILCGDFNSTPFSPLYDFLTKGRLKYEGLNQAQLSGQVSRPGQKFLNGDLIPKEMKVSSLSQKVMPNGDQAIAGLSDSATYDADNGDCIVVGEKIDGKTVVVEERGVLKHLLHLQSAYKYDLHQDGKEVTSSQGAVDYILFSQGMEKTVEERLCSEDDIYVNVLRKQLYLTGVLGLLSRRDLVAMHSIPNPILSSDHLALLAHFRLLQ